MNVPQGMPKLPDLTPHNLAVIEGMKSITFVERYIRRFVRSIQRIAKWPYGVILWFNIVPYIVLGIIIYTIYVLIKSPNNNVYTKIGSGTKKVYTTGKTWWQKIWAVITWPFRKLKELIKPSYKFRLFIRSISPFQGALPSTQRQQMMSGRCDHLRWIQDTSDGAQGFCHSAIRPKDIVWEMDMSKLPEYFELPDERRAEMQSRLKIRIPYSVYPQDSFYVPECDRATFIDYKDANGNEMPAPLFEDTGMACKMREVPSMKYTKRVRARNEGLSTLVEESTPSVS